jgi:IclR family acetate operon transcriptional repressor
MFDNYEVVYIEKVESKLPFRLELMIGGHVPLHCTAIGKLLFANFPSRKRQFLFSVGPLKRFTPNTITDPQELESSFKKIRKQHYSLNDQEFALGVVAVAVPIKDEKGQVVAGVSIQGADSRLNAESCLKVLPTLYRSAEILPDMWKLDSGPVGGGTDS